MTPVPVVSILGRQIGEGHPCFVVAEVGTNHEGDLDAARETIRQAKLAGADAVKFQSFLADELVPRKHPEYEYLKKTEMPRRWYPELLDTAKKNNVIVFSTASNCTTLGWMEELDFPCYKIASGNLTHLPLIRLAARTGKPLIMSTGYAGMDEIQEAVSCAREAGSGQIALLHCVGNYPARMDEVNLLTMDSLRQSFCCPIGYSDHTVDVTACEVAAAKGASLIEKHFVGSRRQIPDSLAVERMLLVKGLDASAQTPLELSDGIVSADFIGFFSMVNFIRTMESTMGQPGKVLGKREQRNGLSARRILHAAQDIAAGTEMSEDMVLYLRPTGRTESMTGKMLGLPPEAISWVTGRKARRNIAAQSPIHWQDMEILDAEP